MDPLEKLAKKLGITVQELKDKQLRECWVYLSYGIGMKEPLQVTCEVRTQTGTIGSYDVSDKYPCYPNEIIKEDKKQFDKLIKEVASMKKEDKKYSSSNLLKLKMQHTAEFSAIIKKLVSMAEKDIVKNK